MKRDAINVVLAALLLAGCTLGMPQGIPPRTLSDPQIAWLRSEVNAAGDACRARRLAGLGGFVTSVKCSNPPITAAYQRVDYPHMSLLNEALAKRLQLAERADAKKISEGDMNVEFFSDVRGLPAMSTP